MPGIGSLDASDRNGRSAGGFGSGAALAAWLLFTLVGCARVADEDRVTWSCARTADGGNWNCTQERMRNGVPLGPVTGNTAAQPIAAVPAKPDAAASSAAAATADVAAPSPGPLDPKPLPKASWSERLPGLAEGQTGVEASPVALPALQAESPARPPPEPEPALARWAGAQVPDTLTPSSRVGQPVTVPAAPPQDPTSAAGISAVPIARGAESKNGDDRTSSGSASTADARATPADVPYTVQLGAFNSLVDARAFIDRHELGELALEVRAVVRNDREYQVVTFGSFGTVREATAAWRRAAPGRELDFWVRPVR